MGDAWDDTPLPVAQQPQPIIKPRPTTHVDYNRSLTRSFNNLNVNNSTHSDHSDTNDTTNQAKEVAAVLNTGKVNIKIKKRDSNNNLNKSNSNNSIHSTYSNASTAEKLASDREAEYERLRAQIFANDSTTPAQPSNTTTQRTTQHSKSMNHKSKATGHVDLLNSVVAGQRRTGNTAQQNSDSSDYEYRRNRAVRPPVDNYVQYDNRSYDTRQYSDRQYNDRQYDRYDDNEQYDEYGQRIRKPNVYSANDCPTLGR